MNIKFKKGKEEWTITKVTSCHNGFSLQGDLYTIEKEGMSIGTRANLESQISYYSKGGYNQSAKVLQKQIDSNKTEKVVNEYWFAANKINLRELLK